MGLEKLEKIEQQWKDYNKEYDSSEFMDIETHTSMAMQVGVLIKEVKRLTNILEENNLPLHPCADCGKEERNPGLSVCGSCYHERIWGNE